MAEPPTPRARQIVAAARELLEAEGAEALTMRRLAERLGIRAPSLYKHLPDKAALEAAIIAAGLEEVAAALEAAVEGAAQPLAALAAAYRAFALDHPHLYRLMTERPRPASASLRASRRERPPPPLAHRALEVDRQIGLLLPCNVVVRTDGDQTVVEALDPR